MSINSDRVLEAAKKITEENGRCGAQSIAEYLYITPIDKEVDHVRSIINSLKDIDKWPYSRNGWSVPQTARGTFTAIAIDESEAKKTKDIRVNSDTKITTPAPNEPVNIGLAEIMKARDLHNSIEDQLHGFGIDVMELFAALPRKAQHETWNCVSQLLNVVLKGRI